MVAAEATLLVTGFVLVAASAYGLTDYGRRRSHDLVARAVGAASGAVIVWAAIEQSLRIFEYGTAPPLFAASVVACARSKGAFVWVFIAMFCFVWLMYVAAVGILELRYVYG